MDERERRLSTEILSLNESLAAVQRQLESTEAELGRTRALLNDERAERDLRDNPGGDIPFAFPGGAVSLPIPTRAALILSAKQWATAGRERAQFDSCNYDGSADFAYIASCCERIEKTLDELVKMESNNG
jgi:hypothetical protein